MVQTQICSHESEKIGKLGLEQLLCCSYWHLNTTTPLFSHSKNRGSLTDRTTCLRRSQTGGFLWSITFDSHYFVCSIHGHFQVAIDSGFSFPSGTDQDQIEQFINHSRQPRTPQSEEMNHRNNVMGRRIVVVKNTTDAAYLVSPAPRRPPEITFRIPCTGSSTATINIT